MLRTILMRGLRFRRGERAGARAQRVEQGEQLGRARIDGGALALHRRVVAADDRAGERRARTVRRPVLDGAAHQRVRAAIAASSGASPAVAAISSAAASSVTTKFDAIDAAAWYPAR